MAHICCGYIQNGGYLRSTNASYAATRSGSSLTLNTAATRIGTDDWVPGANLGDCALIASWSSASYSAAYNPFDGDGASINAGGVTKMVLASAKLRTGTAPTKYEFVDFTVPTSGTNLGMFIVLYDMPEPEQKP